MKHHISISIIALLFLSGCGGGGGGDGATNLDVVPERAARYDTYIEPPKITANSDVSDSPIYKPRSDEPKVNVNLGLIANLGSAEKNNVTVTTAGTSFFTPNPNPNSSTTTRSAALELASFSSNITPLSTRSLISPLSTRAAVSSSKATNSSEIDDYVHIDEASYRGDEGVAITAMNAKRAFKGKYYGAIKQFRVASKNASYGLRDLLMKNEEGEEKYNGFGALNYDKTSGNYYTLCTASESANCPSGRKPITVDLAQQNPKKNNRMYMSVDGYKVSIHDEESKNFIKLKRLDYRESALHANQLLKQESTIKIELKHTENNAKALEEELKNANEYKPPRGSKHGLINNAIANINDEKLQGIVVAAASSVGATDLAGLKRVLEEIGERIRNNPGLSPADKQKLEALRAVLSGSRDGGSDKETQEYKMAKQQDNANDAENTNHICPEGSAATKCQDVTAGEYEKDYQPKATDAVAKISTRHAGVGTTIQALLDGDMKIQNAKNNLNAFKASLGDGVLNQYDILTSKAETVRGKNDGNKQGKTISGNSGTNSFYKIKSNENGSFTLEIVNNTGSAAITADDISKNKSIYLKQVQADVDIYPLEYRIISSKDFAKDKDQGYEFTKLGFLSYSHAFYNEVISEKAALRKDECGKDCGFGDKQYVDLSEFNYPGGSADKEHKVKALFSLTNAAKENLGDFWHIFFQGHTLATSVSKYKATYTGIWNYQSAIEVAHDTSMRIQTGLNEKDKGNKSGDKFEPWLGSDGDKYKKFDLGFADNYNSAPLKNGSSLNLALKYTGGYDDYEKTAFFDVDFGQKTIRGKLDRGTAGGGSERVYDIKGQVYGNHFIASALFNGDTSNLDGTETVTSKSHWATLKDKKGNDIDSKKFFAHSLDRGVQGSFFGPKSQELGGYFLGAKKDGEKLKPTITVAFIARDRGFKDTDAAIELLSAKALKSEIKEVVQGQQKGSFEVDTHYANTVSHNALWLDGGNVLVSLVAPLNKEAKSKVYDEYIDKDTGLVLEHEYNDDYQPAQNGQPAKPATIRTQKQTRIENSDYGKHISVLVADIYKDKYTQAYVNDLSYFRQALVEQIDIERDDSGKATGSKKYLSLITQGVPATEMPTTGQAKYVGEWMMIYPGKGTRDSKEISPRNKNGTDMTSFTADFATKKLNGFLYKNQGRTTVTDAIKGGREIKSEDVVFEIKDAVINGTKFSVTEGQGSVIMKNTLNADYKIEGGSVIVAEQVPITTVKEMSGGFFGPKASELGGSFISEDKSMAVSFSGKNIEGK